MHAKYYGLLALIAKRGLEFLFNLLCARLSNYKMKLGDSSHRNKNVNTGIADIKAQKAVSGGTQHTSQLFIN
jgi:hypothetical protein